MSTLLLRFAGLLLATGPRKGRLCLWSFVQFSRRSRRPYDAYWFSRAIGSHPHQGRHEVKEVLSDRLSGNSGDYLIEPDGKIR